MEKRYLTEKNGVYHADIDITVKEWKRMLEDENVFYDKALKMLEYWYKQENYAATSKEIMVQNNLDSNPFNGIVRGLGMRIIKYLNRFEIIGIENKKSYFIIPFEGWREKGLFIWKIRPELVQAIKESGIFDNTDVVKYEDDLDNNEFYESRPEGKVRVRYSTQYERDSLNRRIAIQMHGTKCQICGFDFEKFYGKRGEGYIEVHHIKPLYVNHEEMAVNPKTDLICVCSNCHRMFHRKRDYVPTPEELREEIQRNGQK